MRILVVSPIASHPQNQGNSARIYRLCQQLQSLGNIIHYLYYPLEGLDNEQTKSMSICWDYFHTMQCDLPNLDKTNGSFYGVDDWFDPKLGAYAKKLHNRWGFDLVLVNYVWFSGVLEYLPDTIYKVIDTHDVFGNRHQRFIDIGMEPEWIYVTPEDEKKGLLRANTIIAIQDQEEIYFKKLMADTNTNVTTIGYALPPMFINNYKNIKTPVIGYLGSGNPFNVRAINEFVNKVKINNDLVASYKFSIAGGVCDKLSAVDPFLKIGKIADLNDFYMNVDIVINPMTGGTGLKIKTLEALSFGLPFIGTHSALEGVNVVSTKSKDANLVKLKIMLEDTIGADLTALSERESKLTFLHYNSQQLINLTNLVRGSHSA